MIVQFITFMVKSYYIYGWCIFTFVVKSYIIYGKYYIDG